MHFVSRFKIAACVFAVCFALCTRATTARAAINFTKYCDVAQGYNFKQDEHHTFGYITSLSIGDNNIAPDIKVAEPTSLNAIGASAGTTGAGGTNTSSIFTKPVVGVLSSTSWSTLPNENIFLQARISLANAQQLQALTLQSLKKVVMRISFVVYEYDLVNQVYYTSFRTWYGTAPNGTNPKTGTGFGNITDNPIYALLGQTSGTQFGIKIGSKPETDVLGIRNYTLDLSIAPPIASAPQQILIQTSNTIKLVQPWGIPQK